MSSKQPTYFRILGIAVSTRGFGYAVLEGGTVLADAGATGIQGKWSAARPKLEAIFDRYRPEIVVLQEMDQPKAKRSRRIRRANTATKEWANAWNIKVVMLTREEIRLQLLDDENATKQEIARHLAERFREDLAHRLPPPRKPWTSEDRRMDVIDAIALAVTSASRPAYCEEGVPLTN